MHATSLLFRILFLGCFLVSCAAHRKSMSSDGKESERGLKAVVVDCKKVPLSKVMVTVVSGTDPDDQNVPRCDTFSRLDGSFTCYTLTQRTGGNEKKVAFVDGHSYLIVLEKGGFHPYRRLYDYSSSYKKAEFELIDSIFSNRDVCPELDDPEIDKARGGDGSPEPPVSG